MGADIYLKMHLKTTKRFIQIEGDGHIHRLTRYATESLKQLYTFLRGVIFSSSLGPNVKNFSNTPTSLYYS